MKMFPPAVLESGPLISFYRRFLIETVCKKNSIASVELFFTSDNEIVKRSISVHTIYSLEFSLWNTPSTYP